MGSRVRNRAARRLRWVLALDPGTHMGWALFHEGKLVASGHCKRQALQKGALTPQAQRAGHTLPPEVLEPDCSIIGELPTYRGKGSGDNRGTPNDLIWLGVLLGQATGLYMRKVEVVDFVTPNEWKGSVSKEISHRRIEKLLEPDEQMPENPNARDAVGVGLWYVGRYKR